MRLPQVYVCHAESVAGYITIMKAFDKEHKAIAYCERMQSRDNDYYDYTNYTLE